MYAISEVGQPIRGLTYLCSHAASRRDLRKDTIQQGLNHDLSHLAWLDCSGKR
jgi:hypothetical protein